MMLFIRFKDPELVMHLAVGCVLDPRYDVGDHIAKFGLELNDVKERVIQAAVAEAVRSRPETSGDEGRCMVTTLMVLFNQHTDSV